MTIRYVRRDSRGAGDGSDWANAAAWTDVAAQLGRAGAGGEVWLHADDVYDVTATAPFPLLLDVGGSPGSPVALRGAKEDGTPAWARIRGDRANPFVGSPPHGSPVFELAASHLDVSHLDARNTGPVFRTVAPCTQLHFDQLRARNVQWLWWLSSLVDGASFRRSHVVGLSRMMLLVGGGSRNILAEDLYCDSQEQSDSSGFPQLFKVDGGAAGCSDVTFRRCVGRRVRRESGAKYWNGDVFVTEVADRNITFEDCVGTGSTDGIFDLKSDTTVLRRCSGTGGKRNFRLWKHRFEAYDCVSKDPLRLGGTGSVAHIAINDAVVDWHGGRLLSQNDAGAAAYLVTSSSGVGPASIDHYGGSVELGEMQRLEDAPPGAVRRHGTRLLLGP